MQDMLGKLVTVIIDRPLGSVHPRHTDLKYTINYGYIEGMMTGDGEEQDAYVLGVDCPLEKFTGKVIAIIHRKNDIEDKLVVAPEDYICSKIDVAKATYFQEQYFDIEIEMKKICKVGLTACSNGLGIQVSGQIEKIENFFETLGLEVEKSLCIYRKETIWSGTAEQRAEALMHMYLDKEVVAIYDVSGGDLANEILPYLDFDLIKKNNKPFWGYSDLTTIINAIYTRTGNLNVLYQIRNILEHDSFENYGLLQRKEFTQFVKTGMDDNNEGNELFQVPYCFLQGEYMEGIVVGGNIRCLLKLAGTPYFPDVTGKILLLEARSGESVQMTTYLSQLKQMGVFEKITGILLGTFTQMEKEGCEPDIKTLVVSAAGEHIPIAKTDYIGHGLDSKAIVIGKKYCFGKDNK